MGRTDFVPRPHKPGRILFSDGFASNRGGRYDNQIGLLAYGGKYNRPVDRRRVNDYAREIEAGR